MIYCSLTVTSTTITADINKQVTRYEKVKFLDLSFTEFKESLYNPENQYIIYKNFDLVESTLWFTLGKLNAPKEALLIIMALLMALPSIYNLKILEYYRRTRELSWTSLILMFLIFITPFWLINGFRFHLATLVAMSAIFSYFLMNKNRLALILWLLTPLIHFGYLFIVPVLPFFILFRNFNSIALLFSSALNLLPTKGLFVSARSVLYGFIPESLVSQGDDYVSDERLENSFEAINYGKSFHAAYYQEAMHYFIFISSLLFFFLIRKMSPGPDKKRLSDLLTVVLFTNGLIGMFASIPGAKRFEVIEQCLFLSLIIILMSLAHSSLTKHNAKRILFFASPLFLFWLIVEFRKSFDILTLSTVFSNFFTFMGANDLPLIELIK